MTIHPSKSRSPQLPLGTVAEMKEVTADTLKKPQVKDDKGLGVSGEDKQWTWAPRNSVRHVEEPY